MKPRRKQRRRAARRPRSFPRKQAWSTASSAPATWPIPLQITLPPHDCGNAVVGGTVVATFTNGDPELALALSDTVNGVYTSTWTPRTSTAQVTITANAAAPGLASASALINGAVVPNVAPALNQSGIVECVQSAGRRRPGARHCGGDLRFEPGCATGATDHWCRLPTKLNGSAGPDRRHRTHRCSISVPAR